MAVTNTGIVERNITGVNESDLWLDTEATSSVSNTGAVERSITGVHDANFVRPLGDELIANGDFSNGAADWVDVDGSATFEDGSLKIQSNGTTLNRVLQSSVTEVGKSYKLTYEVKENNAVSTFRYYNGAAYVGVSASVGTHSESFVAGSNSSLFLSVTDTDVNSYIVLDNFSVKEMLVNRESTATNTGIVERGVTGVNESDLWLDAESTSVVNNTGIVERPITGVHDANFVKPLGDELIVNSGFDADTAWTKGTGWSIGDGVAIRDNTAGNSYIGQSVSLVGGKTYEFNFKVNSITGTGSVYTPSTAETIATYTTIGDKKIYFTPSNTQIYILGWYGISGAELEIDNVSVKEVLVTRDSSVVNIAEVIIPLLDSLEARATTFENREATQEILINLQKC